LMMSRYDAVGGMQGMAPVVWVWAGSPFMLLTEPLIGSETIALWLADTIAWAGVATTLYWMTGPLHRRLRPAAVVAPAVPIILESEKRSEQDACERCRAAAASPTTGEPLVRVAHSSEGPRFLYRCSACHSYWLKQVDGTRVISAVLVRQLFPNAAD